MQDLHKTYANGTQAVRSVSFDVARGEIFGILGPNGAGKSTLIGILGTIVRPTGGRALVDGLDVTRSSLEVRHRVGFAMQEAGVDTLARGREFLKLQGRLYGLPKRLVRERSKELLELFELEHAAHKLIGGYSGGMKRRIDLAGALIHRPPIVFLDEPTEGLDPRSRRVLWDQLLRLNGANGTTILLSTHYMEEAEYLCQRIAIMDQGKVVAIGTPDELKAQVGGEAIVLSYDSVGAQGQGRRDRARDVIKRQSTTTDLREAGNELIVYVEDAARTTPGLLHALDAANASPDSLTLQKPSLDDVYLKFTGKTLEAAESDARAATAATSEARGPGKRRKRNRRQQRPPEEALA